MERNSAVYVAGRESALGNALWNRLKASGYENLLLAPGKNAEYVIVSAGKSGSLAMNIEYPADLIEENLQIELNAIGAARRNKARKLLFFGASCIYPLNAPQPIKEESYLTSALEPTSQAYAVAKIAGVELCRAIARQDGLNFFTVVPATIYGPGTVFDAEHSHVLTALVKKLCDAKARGEREVVLLGTGKPLREFIHIGDLADACVFLMEHAEEPGGIFNVGSGEEISIRDLAEKVKTAAGFEGELRFDASKPDGAMRKLLDSTKIRSMGWSPKTPLDEGIRETVRFYEESALRST